MYTIDDQHEIVSLDAVLKHSSGAPMPLVLANDIGLVLVYEIAPAGDEGARDVGDVGDIGASEAAIVLQVSQIPRDGSPLHDVRVCADRLSRLGLTN